MKKCIIVSLLLFPPTLIHGSANYPIKLIIKNITNKSLSVSVEYELDQHYTRSLDAGTPFLPNNTRFHPPTSIGAGQTKTVYVFAFNPCAKQYCSLQNNLQKEGFIKHYKVIQGSVTITQHNRSYDFKVAVFDGATITCNITHNGITLKTIKEFETKQAGK